MCMNPTRGYLWYVVSRGAAVAKTGAMGGADPTGTARKRLKDGHPLPYSHAMATLHAYGDGLSDTSEYSAFSMG